MEGERIAESLYQVIRVAVLVNWQEGPSLYLPNLSSEENARCPHERSLIAFI